MVCHKVAGSLVAFLIVTATGVFAQDYSTRNQLADKVRYQLRMVGDTFSLPNYALWDFVQTAGKETDNKVRPNEKKDTIWTTALDADYDLNADCYQNGVIAARILLDSVNGTYQSLRSSLSRDIGQVLPEISSDYPLWYSTFGNKIFFEPTPLLVYRIEIEYEARSVSFGNLESDSTDSVTTIPPELDQLIIDYARYLVKKRLNLDAEADGVLAGWKQSVAEQRAILQKRPDPLVSPVKERGQ